MKFSCIIPAYNEWSRIAKVIETVLACHEIDEVIVVNDGSTDNTREIIDSFVHPKLQKIHQKNGGKAQAIFTGIGQSRWEYIVMIDSDLLNLKSEHITALLYPIVENISDVSLSIRENSLGIYKFLGTDFVSWERVLPRSLFEEKEYFTSWPGFWLEVKLNKKIIEKNYRVKNIYLPWVISPRKSTKYGFIHWTLADWKMNFDILSVMPLHRILYQLWYFSRFSSK